MRWSLQRDESEKQKLWKWNIGWVATQVRVRVCVFAHMHDANDFYPGRRIKENGRNGKNSNFTCTLMAMKLVVWVKLPLDSFDCNILNIATFMRTLCKQCTRPLGSYRIVQFTDGFYLFRTSAHRSRVFSHWYGIDGIDGIDHIFRRIVNSVVNICRRKIRVAILF